MRGVGSFGPLVSFFWPKGAALVLVCFWPKEGRRRQCPGRESRDR